MCDYFLTWTASYRPGSVRISGKLHTGEIQTEDHVIIDILSFVCIPPDPKMPGELMDRSTPHLVNDVLYRLDSSTDLAGENSPCDIILFHGHMFDIGEDWSCKTWITDRECHPWPATWLPQDLKLPQTRVFSVKYGQALGSNEVQKVLNWAEELAKKLTSHEQSLGLGKALTVLVGHGIGGSIIKHMLLTMESIAGRWDEAQGKLQKTLRSFLSSIKGIYFYASSEPDEGATKVEASKRYFQYLERLRMRMRSSPDLAEGLDRNPSPRRTNEDFKTFRRRRNIKTYELTLAQQFPSITYGIGSEKSKIVAPYDVDKYQVAEARVRYDTICKPKDKADYRYRTLKRFIQGLIIANMMPDSYRNGASRAEKSHIRG